MLRSDLEDALLRQISRLGGDALVRVTWLDESSVIWGEGAIPGRGVEGSPTRGVIGLDASFIGGGSGNGSCIMISFSSGDGSSYGLLLYALYAFAPCSLTSPRPASLSGEREATLPLVTELPCEDLCTESEEVFEYADNRLEMEETRFSFFASAISVWAGWAGGGGNDPTAGGDPTAFLGIGGIFFWSSGSDAFAGSAGNGSS
ncbi:hypothetical protein TruAng_006179 [Truncatella angustata]|nr:hypothetical protein TruAng_006179 [Truncatella angustata]